MKVLNVTFNHADCWGGTTCAVSSFADALEGDILSFTSESLLPTARHGKGIYHISVPDSLPGRIYGLPEAPDLQRAREIAKDYDVLICHMLYRYHTNWTHSVGKPYFIVPHGSLDPYVFTYRRWQKELWIRLFGKRYFQKAEAVIFATSREQQKAYRGIGGDRARVIHWAVDEGANRGPSRAEARIQYGLREEDRALLYIGRLHSMKRPLETIRAFAEAATKNLHLIVAGPEEQYSVGQLKAEADRLGTSNIHILGPVYGDAKWGLYRAADGYISLSNRENFGYTLAEAMSQGLPSILSPGNDLGYELDDVQCAWRLAEDGHEAAVAGIRSFADADEATLRAMGLRGKQWVAEHATFDRFQENLQRLIWNPKCLSESAGGGR